MGMISSPNLLDQLIRSHAFIAEATGHDDFLVADVDCTAVPFLSRTAENLKVNCFHKEADRGGNR